MSFSIFYSYIWYIHLDEHLLDGVVATHLLAPVVLLVDPADQLPDSLYVKAVTVRDFQREDVERLVFY
jgi:hypothetical protein